MNNSSRSPDYLGSLLREEVEYARYWLQSASADEYCAARARLTTALERFTGYLFRTAVPEEIEPVRARAVVMVVDDDPSVLMVIEGALSRYGYWVLSASNGEDALAMARAFQGHINVVLSDIAMPGMDGRELVARMRKENLADGMILMTGFMLTGLIPEGREILQKPFLPAALIDRIELALAA